jgi:hypothetical protein
MNDKALLDGHKVKVVSNLIEWAKGLEKQDRRVARTSVGKVEVSTVFLGLDHSFGGKPLWFETMVFGGSLDQEQERYTTWEEAEAGHAAMVERVKAAV